MFKLLFKGIGFINGKNSKSLVIRAAGWENFVFYVESLENALFIHHDSGGRKPLRKSLQTIVTTNQHLQYTTVHKRIMDMGGNRVENKKALKNSRRPKVCCRKAVWMQIRWIFED